MKTTITILAYNHERYIRESLASALVQSRAADEIIVIDDASPDGTAGIIEKFIAEHPDRTIRFVRNERNLGVTGSFTKAISMASGDILISMAGDDISAPSRVERCVAHLVAHPYAMAVITNAHIIDNDSRHCGILDNCVGMAESVALGLEDLPTGLIFLEVAVPAVRQLPIALKYSDHSLRSVTGFMPKTIRSHFGPCCLEPAISYPSLLCIGAGMRIILATEPAPGVAPRWQFISVNAKRWSIRCSPMPSSGNAGMRAGSGQALIMRSQAFASIRQSGRSGRPLTRKGLVSRHSFRPLKPWGESTCALSIHEGNVAPSL